MAVRFLRAIRDVPPLRKDIRLLPPARAEAFTGRLGDVELPPPDLDWSRAALRAV